MPRLSHKAKMAKVSHEKEEVLPNPPDSRLSANLSHRATDQLTRRFRTQYVNGDLVVLHQAPSPQVIRHPFNLAPQYPARQAASAGADPQPIYMAKPKTWRKPFMAAYETEIFSCTETRTGLRFTGCGLKKKNCRRCPCPGALRSCSLISALVARYLAWKRAHDSDISIAERPN